MKREKRFGWTLRRVQGDSMQPALKSGQIVLARYTQEVRPGQVVIAKHGQIPVIKRVDQVHGNLVFVLGDNSKASTDSRTFGWLEKATIVAVVVWPRGV